ncbi:hypothetical protein TFLX_05979 [Thermoflexales bacterium]|nr:hypothetical protein TFLX_05979 [Thermoflexales bacterium]
MIWSKKKALRTNLPDYVDSDIGLPVFRGPYLQQDTQMAVLFFQADADRLTALCDRYLNAPSEGQTKYVPFMSHVAVVFAETLATSGDERDRRVGRLPETEASFWILTVAMRKVGPIFVPDRLVWFVPFLFANEGDVIATGREVYGFNKQLGQFQKPPVIQQPEFSIDVMGIKEFKLEAEGRVERLLEMQHTDRATGAEPSGTWSSWDKAKAAITPEILKTLATDSKNKAVEVATLLVTHQMRLVFLKQFRDVTQTQQACYQAIIEAPLMVQTFRQGGFLAGEYVMTVNPLDSHPLADVLGLRLENGAQRSRLGLWMKLDFMLGEGIEIWKAE